jgi:hypothetical protein
MIELKPLSAKALPAALEKAVRYRLLNEPLQAESICLDILDVDPNHREALITLLLALTDQFTDRLGGAFREAQEVASRIVHEYDRAYYLGIICERRANAHRTNGGPGSDHLAYEWFRRAMEHYEKAAEMRPPGNDDAILRWNTCARILNRHRELNAAPKDSFEPLLE